MGISSLLADRTSFFPLLFIPFSFLFLSFFFLSFFSRLNMEFTAVKVMIVVLALAIIVQESDAKLECGEVGGKCCPFNIMYKNRKCKSLSSCCDNNKNECVKDPKCAKTAESSLLANLFKIAEK